MLKRRLTEPFGKAGLTVAILALVMALVGGAYAAGGLTKSQEKQVKKIAKKYAGKPGAPGAAGAPGPQGPAGANGKDGANGTNGTNGKDGTNGTNGKSVIVKNQAPPTCVEGGVTYEVEGSGQENEVCNGEKGETGFTETLPSGKTETGTVHGYAYAPGSAFEQTFKLGAISFPIPVPIPAGSVEGIPAHVITIGKPPTTECPGTSETPEAAPGNLCLYMLELTNVEPPFDLRWSFHHGFANSYGAFLEGKSEVNAGQLEFDGTWAVTAE